MVPGALLRGQPPPEGQGPGAGKTGPGWPLLLELDRHIRSPVGESLLLGFLPSKGQTALATAVSSLKLGLNLALEALKNCHESD